MKTIQAKRKALQKANMYTKVFDKLGEDYLAQNKTNEDTENLLYRLEVSRQKAMRKFNSIKI